jgi:sugar phosphate permease
MATPWLSLAIYSALLFLVGFDMSTLAVIILFIIVSPVQSVQNVAFESIMSDVTLPSERIGGFSLLRISANVGIGVGLVVGGFLSELSYAYVFLLPVGGSIVEGILYYTSVSETSPRIMSGSPPPVHEKLVIPYNDLLFIGISIVISFSWFVTGFFESPITPLYLTSDLGYPNLYVTALFAVNTMVVIFLQSPLNVVLKRVSDTSRIMLGLALFAVGYLFFWQFTQYVFLIVAVIIMTIGENMNAPASVSLITKLAPEDRRGAYFGLNSSISSVIVPFRPFAGTLLLAITFSSPATSWLVIAMLNLAMIAVIAGFVRSIRREMNNRASH